MRCGYVYIMANSVHSVLYIGVTNNVERRVAEHRSRLADSFTKRYKVHKLVWYEQLPDIRQAIEAEKKLKSYSRSKKAALVRTTNPAWRDLAEDFNLEQ